MKEQMNERKRGGMKECMYDMHKKARKKGQRSKDDARSEARRDGRKQQRQ